MTKAIYGDKIADNIARWIARRQAGELNPEEIRQFDDWLAESKERRETYLEYQNSLALVDAAADEILAREFEREIEEEFAASHKHRRSLVWPAIAASIILAVAVSVVFFNLNLSPKNAQQFATAVGERRDVVLDDGSSARMNTDSLVEVAYTRNRRNVNLKHGEAYFEVRHDTSRPFIVDAPGGEIKVTGTSFNVRIQNSNMEVSTISGTVLVTPDGKTTPVTLKAGDRLKILKDGVVQASRFDRNSALAWLHGKAVYKNAPLRDVVADLNRYFSKPIVLSDELPNELPVTGEFNIYDQSAVVDALTVAFDLDAHVTPQSILLSPAHASGD